MDKPKNLKEVLALFDEQKDKLSDKDYGCDGADVCCGNCGGNCLDPDKIKSFITSSFTSLLEQLRQKEEPLPAILWKDEHEENLVKQIKNSMIKKFNNSLDTLIWEK